MIMNPLFGSAQSSTTAEDVFTVYFPVSILVYPCVGDILECDIGIITTH